MLDFVSAVTGGCFFILSFIIFVHSQKANKIANRLLAILLFSIGLLVIDDALLNIHFYKKFPLFIGYINIPVFSLAPILYLTVDYFVTPAKKFTWSDLWHFLLLFLISILTIFYMFLPTELKLKDLETPKADNDNIIGLLLVVFPIAFYWFRAYKKLLIHEKNVLLFSSSIETVDLTWLRYFLWGLAAMVLALLSDFVVDIPIRTYITSFIYLISAFYIAYFATQQGEVFSLKYQEALDIKEVIDENQHQNEYRKKVLTDEQITILKPVLTDLMVEKKLYLNPNLSLSKLAEQLEISTHELSYLINAGFEDNFFGFINYYRVEESKRLLSTPQYPPLSMVGIAYEAGFNSKTAFNTTFKKLTGMSPSDYRKLNCR